MTSLDAPAAAHVADIDVDDLRRGDREAVTALGLALERQGIVALRRPFPFFALDRLRDVACRLFDLPAADIASLTFRSNGSIVRGCGVSKPAEARTGSPCAGPPALYWLFVDTQRNLYPSNRLIGSGRRVLTGAARRFRELAQVVRDALSGYLGDVSGRFSEMTTFRRSFHGHPLVFNLSRPEEGESPQLNRVDASFSRADAHTDYTNVFTLLTNTVVGGLQIEPLTWTGPGERWLDVTHGDQDAVFVLTGAQAATLTSGRLKPVRHRVVGSPRQIRQVRLSIAYAYSANQMTPWYDLVSGELVPYKGRLVAPGAWVFLLDANTSATPADLGSYLDAQFSVARELRTWSRRTLARERAVHRS